MNALKKILALSLIVSLLLLALPEEALAAPPGKVVMGDSFTLESGEILHDDLLIMGGSVRLEDGSVVTGNVVVMGGTLSAAGEIKGDLIAMGGVVSLLATASVEGDFSSFGAQVERDQAADIQGEIITEQDIPFNIVPGTFRNTFVSPTSVHPFLNLGWFVLQVVLWGLLAMLVVMFLPRHTERITRAICNQPWVAGGLGLATGLILPILLVVLMLTICLIPVSLIGLLLLFVAWAYGIIAIGLELGTRFGRLFSQEWQPALAAGAGTFLLMLVLNGLSAVLPCIGWIPQIVAGALGLGAVLLTRFGIQEYPDQAAEALTVEPPPAS